MITREGDEETAMEVTTRERPREEEDEGVGDRNFVQIPWRTFYTPSFSSAPTKRCLPDVSYVILQSTETITPKDAAASYRRYDFTISVALQLEAKGLCKRWRSRIIKAES